MGTFQKVEQGVAENSALTPQQAAEPLQQSESPAVSDPWAVGGNDASWFVLHVKSRQEKALCADLERAGIICFLPMNHIVRYHGRRKVRVAEPLFAGYVFLKGSRDSAFTADRTRRVASILPVVDQQRLEAELRQLRSTLERVGFLTPVSLLEPGVRVEVMSGPFKGVVGQVASVGGRNQLVLSISALGQGAALELDGSLVKPVEG